MRAMMVCAVLAMCAACGGSPSEPTGSGGDGGGNTGGQSGGTTSTSSTTSSSTTSTTTDTCPTSGDNVYDNASESGLPACYHPVAPTMEEDGTFAVTVFGPFVSAFTLEGFSFSALESASLETVITDPWTVSVVVVAKGDDPLAVNPNDAAMPYALALVGTEMSDDGPVNRYTITLDAPLSVGACDTVVVSLRNTYGPPSTAIMMCGDGSAHPETNQWFDVDGTMHEMKSYAPAFDRDWWMTLVPSP